MALNDRSTIIIDILNALLRKLDKWDVVEIPLYVVKSGDIAFVIKEVRGFQVSIRDWIWTIWILGQAEI
jgi:hypothetical protein